MGNFEYGVLHQLTQIEAEELILSSVSEDTRDQFKTYFDVCDISMFEFTCVSHGIDKSGLNMIEIQAKSSTTETSFLAWLQ